MRRKTIRATLFVILMIIFAGLVVWGISYYQETVGAGSQALKNASDALSTKYSATATP